MNSKPFLTSRTFWVNALIFLAVLLDADTARDVFREHTTAVAGVFAALQTCLRLLTTRPAHILPAEQKPAHPNIF